MRSLWTEMEEQLADTRSVNIIALSLASSDLRDYSGYFFTIPLRSPLARLPNTP